MNDNQYKARFHQTVSPLEKLRASTNVISDQEYKEAFINVSHVASEVLSRTLGPYAHTTIIDDGSYRYSTKDGWSIANRIVFNDALANSLFAFIKSISFSLVSKVGDGTTTAIVASDKFISAMAEHPEIKLRQRDYLAMMDVAKEKIINELRNGDYTHIIDPEGDFEDIFKIAYTSTNGNDEIADMIREIYQKTKNPNIYVNIGNDNETTMEIQTGYRLECEPIMLQNYANSDTREFKTDVGTTYAIFFNHNVTYVKHNQLIREILAMVHDSPKFYKSTIVLFAPYFDDPISGAINQAITHSLNQGEIPSLMMVQVPTVNVSQKHFYNDFRAVLGGNFVEEQTVEMFKRLKDPDKFDPDSTENFVKAFANFDQYHSCREVILDYIRPMDHCTVGKNFVLVESYNTESKEYKTVFQEAKEDYERELAESAHRLTDLDRDFMNASMRYTRIHGKMGIINVGGSSELERKCLKDSVDDAVLASRSAYENGYVAGMNLSLISAIQDCISKSDDPNETKFFQMLKEAFVNTDIEIVRNMMPEKTDEELHEFLDPVIQKTTENHCGYNLVTDSYEKPDQLTVINSVNTDIEILKSVISILGYALTSNQMVSLSRSVDRTVMAAVRNADEEDRYYRIGLSIAKAMKDEDIFPMFGTCSEPCIPEDVMDLKECKNISNDPMTITTTAPLVGTIRNEGSHLPMTLDENYEDPQLTIK